MFGDELHLLYKKEVKKILVVQSRVSPERIEKERVNFTRSIGDAAEVAFLSALDERLAWTSPGDFLEGFDGVIFGGSSDFDFHGGRADKDPARIMSMILLSRTKALVSHTIANHVPLLGICFGHQLIANMHGGDVSNDKDQSKFGSFEVRITEDGKADPLFKQLPEKFIAQYAHNDSVTHDPDGATILATGERCKYAALKYGPKAYTLQFHPEVISFEELGVECKPSPEASGIIALWIKHLVLEEHAHEPDNALVS